MRPKMLEPVRLSEASPGPNYPVSLADAKKQMRVEHTDDDDYINDLIAEATGVLSGWNGKLGGVVLMSETWRADYHRFPWARRLDLPLAPVQSITSVVYADTNNADQTLATANYSLHEDAGGAYLWLDAAQSVWPDTYDDRPDAVRVTMLCGHGDDAADVPREIRRAIKVMVAHWYDHREPVIVGAGVASLPWLLDELLADIRRARF